MEIDKNFYRLPTCSRWFWCCRRASILLLAVVNRLLDTSKWHLSLHEQSRHSNSTSRRSKAELEKKKKENFIKKLQSIVKRNHVELMFEKCFACIEIPFLPCTNFKAIKSFWLNFYHRLLIPETYESRENFCYMRFCSLTHIRLANGNLFWESNYGKEKFHKEMTLKFRFFLA